MGNEFGHPEWIDFPRDDTYDPSTGEFVPGAAPPAGPLRARSRRRDAGAAVHARVQLRTAPARPAQPRPQIHSSAPGEALRSVHRAHQLSCRSASCGCSDGHRCAILDFGRPPFLSPVPELQACFSQLGLLGHCVRAADARRGAQATTAAWRSAGGAGTWRTRRRSSTSSWWRSTAR